MSPKVLLEYPNYENNQPPLYYAVGGTVLAAAVRLPGPLRIATPEEQLYLLRALSVCFVLLALLGPFRLLVGTQGASLSVGMLVLLLFPGAAEALARCSNDALLFLWSATVVWLTERRRWIWLAVLLPFGLLSKLTAAPVLVAALMIMWRRRSVRVSLLTAALAVSPVVILRGWMWGGAVRFGPAAAALEGGTGFLLGFARSLYTIAKTTLWLGEWSFFRPPFWLLLPVPVLLAAWLPYFRWKRAADDRVAHISGVVVAMIGVVLFFLANHREFGVWGGVPGWYVWGWMPWLGVAAGNLFQAQQPPARWLVGVSAAYLLAFNVIWFAVAGASYW